jgi:hypothetical protein
MVSRNVLKNPENWGKEFPLILVHVCQSMFQTKNNLLLYFIHFVSFIFIQKRNNSHLVVSQSPYFQAFSATRDALILSWYNLTSVCALSYQLFPYRVHFKGVAAEILLRRWKDITITRRRSTLLHLWSINQRIIRKVGVCSDRCSYMAS